MAKSEHSSFSSGCFLLTGEKEFTDRFENISGGPASLQQRANGARFTLIDKKADSRTAQSSSSKGHHPACNSAC